MLEIVNREKIDIVLLDIRMPEMDGMETARHLAGMADPPAIIFTTAFDAYAIKAFEVNAIDYLLKPIRARAAPRGAAQDARGARPIREALDAAANQPRTPPARSTSAARSILVPLADVLYLRAELKYVTVRTVEREYLVEESLTRLEEEFGDAFVRVHRNCLVARAAIEGFERNAAGKRVGLGGGHPGTGERLPVSRRQQHVVKEFR